MSISLLSVAILFLFIVIMAIEIYRGVKGGLVKSCISLASTVASLVLSVVLSPMLSRFFVWVFRVLLFEPFISDPDNETFSKLYESLTGTIKSLEELIFAAISLVISVIIFLIVFFVIRWTIKAIVWIARKMFAKRQRDDAGHSAEKQSVFFRRDKLVGCIAGAISGIIVTTAILTPFMGMFEVFDRVSTIAEHTNPKIWDRTVLKTDGVESFRRYGKDAVGSVFYELGGKYIFHEIASTEMNGQRIYLVDEAEVVDVIVDNFFDTYKVIQTPGKATHEQADKIRELGVKIGELKCGQELLAEVVSNGANAWLNGNMYFKIRKPKMPALIQPAFDDILKVCAESNENNVKYNIATIANILAIVVECDLAHADIKNYSAAMEFIENTGILEKINAELEANPYMEDIRVSSITMTVVSQYIDPDVLGDRVYEGLMDNVADAINTVRNRGYSSTEEEAEVLTTYALNYISDSGLDIPEDFAEDIAEELLKAFEALPEDVDSEDVKQVFAEFSK